MIIAMTHKIQKNLMQSGFFKKNINNIEIIHTNRNIITVPNTHKIPDMGLPNMPWINKIPPTPTKTPSTPIKTPPTSIKIPIIELPKNTPSIKKKKTLKKKNLYLLF